MRKMKKALAVTLSAAMVMGMSMTTFAADQEVSVDAPIYAYDVTNVVVPTTFVVAFNPNGLNVDTDGGDDTTGLTTSQIVSKNYGIINKSTKDKVITVTLKVEDLNEDKITFASDPDDVTNAAADDYVVNLKAIPADDTNEVKVGATPASADLTTTGADLADAKMTAATGKDIVLVAGENDVDFLLKQATYSGKIDLGSATDNNVADKFTIQSLAAAGKGITAFTFGGTMNAKADWTKLTKGIRITAVYSNDNAPDGAAAEVGTGALYNNPNPVFKAGAEVGTIKYKKGTGNDAIDTIESIAIDYNGTPFDGYHAYQELWGEPSDENGLITFDPKYIAAFAFPEDVLTKEAVVTYTTVGGDTKTATVDVKVNKPVSAAPSFTTGSAIGTINYEVGIGSEALDTIASITIDYNGTPFDGYHAYQTLWTAPSDENGLITFDPQYLAAFALPADVLTKEAIVTYTTVGGETKTASVTVKMQ